MTTSILLPGQLFASETETIGNVALLSQEKTAFLCSRTIPASAVLKCYDWAIEQREKGNCIISGFHSGIEKDVFHYLLAGTQPIIMVLARGMKKRIAPELKEATNAGRLLIITPFDGNVKRMSSGNALPIKVIRCSKTFFERSYEGATTHIWELGFKRDLRAK